MPDRDDILDESFAALDLDLQDELELADEMARDDAEVWFLALLALFREVGYDIAPTLGYESAYSLRARARWAAASVVRTYNKRLRRELQGEIEDWPRRHAGEALTALALAAVGAEWAENYWAWKAGQVGVTETTWVSDKAMRDFLSKNRIQGLVRVVPLRAVCPICQDYVAAGWLPISEARFIKLPAHVSCPHIFEFRELANVPPQEEAWTG